MRKKNKLPENHNFQFGKALPVSRIIFTDFFLFVIVKWRGTCGRNADVRET